MMELNKSVDDIRKELFGFIEQHQDEYIAKGYIPSKINLNRGVIRGVLEVFIFGIWQLYNLLNQIMKQAVPISSNGEWLDIHAAAVNIKRKEKTKAVGVVEFFRDENETANIKIAQGKVVGTLSDGRGKKYRYVTTNETTLTRDKLSVAVPVISEEYGEFTNASAGQINQLITPIAGISKVYNNENWLSSEGSDEESDASLLERYIAQWQKNNGVIAQAYKAVVMGVTGVKSAVVNDNHPRGQGTIDIYILGSAGIPTEYLLSGIKKVLSEEIVINDDVSVLSPVIKDIDIELEIEILNGSPEEIIQTAENNIRTYFQTIQIGEDIIRDRLSARVIDIKGVKKINWILPIAESEIVNISELARLRSINIKTRFVNEA